ncbi:MAG: exopolysaccharide biosynthesis polyprenyl glycosylphosphotransferase [Minisyncoccia bacterium]
MSFLNRREPLILLLGDLVSFAAALWLALLIRSFEIPSQETFLLHLTPFAMLFVVWIFVFYIAGLYEKHTTILKSKLPGALASTQLVNSGIAVAFFYLVPFFGITPKIVLFIYLAISFGLTLVWRIYGYFIIGKREPATAILIGAGDEMKELFNEVNNNPVSHIRFSSFVDLNRADEKGFWGEIIAHIYSEGVSVIVIDLANKNVEPALPHLYNLIFSKISFVDMHKIYEDIFDRIPLSLLKYDWFLENISTVTRGGYDILKRLMDIFIALPLFLLSLVLYPLLALAIKFEDGGPIFIAQERVGKSNKSFKILKFRSMSHDDKGVYGTEHKNVITKVGNFLRKTRIDELPQLWNILKGDLSLIGPRPELPELVKQYEKQIPYYNVRHLIKPGLSGWAQIYHDQHPHHALDSLETAHKLSYDLYYIKNHSLMLDVKIALRTLKILASIAGR